MQKFLIDLVVNPTVLAVAITSFLASRFYRRQLVLSAKKNANDELNGVLRKLRDQTNDLTTKYQQSINFAAQIGNEFRNVPTDPQEAKMFWDNLKKTD